MRHYLDLAADLAVESHLYRFDTQEHDGSLLQAPLKNVRVVCRATQSEKTAWGDGHIANRSAQSAAAARSSLDPHWGADGDARHHGAAGDCNEQATA